jgi:hypothetical protein
MNRLSRKALTEELVVIAEVRRLMPLVKKCRLTPFPSNGDGNSLALFGSESVVF